MLLGSKIVTVLVMYRNSNRTFLVGDTTNRTLRYATLLSFTKGQKNDDFEKKAFCVFSE